MALSTMYPAKNNSPTTFLTEQITAAATTMTLDDATVLPDAPNLAVLGSEDNAEIVSYTAISGNVVSGLVRGVHNTVPSVWAAETPVARNFTALDHDRFIENINELQSEIDELIAVESDGDDYKLVIGG